MSIMQLRMAHVPNAVLSAKRAMTTRVPEQYHASLECSRLPCSCRLLTLRRRSARAGRAPDAAQADCGPVHQLCLRPFQLYRPARTEPHLVEGRHTPEVMAMLACTANAFGTLNPCAAAGHCTSRFPSSVPSAPFAMLQDVDRRIYRAAMVSMGLNA